MDWHQKEIKEVFKELQSSQKGLSTAEAKIRLAKYGPNEIKEKKKRSPIVMFFDQFSDFVILVLIAAAIVSAFIGEFLDALAIICIVILNAIIGFLQEYRAERAIAALKKMAEPIAKLIRDGAVINLPSSQLVPGDIVLLEAGRVVPADMRLIEAVHMRVDESALTGESIPVEKQTKPLLEENLPLGDRKNIAYKGTFVTYGRGTGIVIGTGHETELGRIATMLETTEEVKTPLQKRLAKFGQKLALAILIACAAIFIFNVLRGEPLLLMFLTAVALAVAAIPEALPAVATITLALGAKKMVRQNALVRKLPAVETLGSVTYICSDKTGTLTQNKMMVEEFYVDENLIRSSDLQGQSTNLLQALALNNDAQVDAEGNVIGDPTEIALYTIAKNKGFEKVELEQKFPRLAEIPFDAERKCMTTFHQRPDGRVVSFTKGAVEVLAGKSDTILTAKGLSDLNKDEISRINEKMASDGLRVLAIAMKEWDNLPEDRSPENVEKGLTILGLVGMMDPPREEAKEAVSLCKTAGIKPVMITGDHPLTAMAIARRLGISNGDPEAMITGSELERLPLQEFEKRVEDIRVYARVAPEQKLKIVKALQDKGQIVAMTGDGVNDAPALKRADIGVSMGVAGTDVAKEASHMILLDDNFATIVKAVREGRRIYDNILKFLKYSMTSNVGTIWAIFLAPFFGLPLPMLPIQILWMNLLCDSLPGLALTTEQPEKDVMNRPPRQPTEGVFEQGRGFFILRFGLIIGLAALLLQAYAMSKGMPWQTMVFTALLIGRMAVVMGVRSERDSLFKIGLFSNKPLLGAVFLTIVLQLAAIYVPFLNSVFKTEPLTISELALTFALPLTVFLIMEAEKFFLRKEGKC